MFQSHSARPFRAGGWPRWVAVCRQVVNSGVRDLWLWVPPSQGPIPHRLAVGWLWLSGPPDFRAIRWLIWVFAMNVHGLLVCHLWSPAGGLHNTLKYVACRAIARNLFWGANQEDSNYSVFVLMIDQLFSPIYMYTSYIFPLIFKTTLPVLYLVFSYNFSYSKRLT